MSKQDNRINFTELAIQLRVHFDKFFQVGAMSSSSGTIFVVLLSEEEFSSNIFIVFNFFDFLPRFDDESHDCRCFLLDLVF